MDLMKKIAAYFAGVVAFVKGDDRKVTLWKTILTVTGTLDVSNGVFHKCIEHRKDGRPVTAEVEGSIAAFLYARGLLTNHLRLIKVKGVDSCFDERHNFDVNMLNVRIMKAFKMLSGKAVPVQVLELVEGSEYMVLVTTEPSLVKGEFALKHKARLKANAIRLNDGRPAVQADARIMLWDAGDKVATEDGGLVGIRGLALPNIEELVIPNGMIGEIPLTIRMLGWNNNRLGKANLVLVDQHEFLDVFYAKFGREWTAMDPAIIGPSKTVKNGESGEHITVDILVHKVNAKGGMTMQGVDYKEILVNEYVDGVLEMITERIGKKAAKVMAALASKEALVEYVKKTEEKELLKLANEDDVGGASKLTAFRDLVLAEMDISLFPKETLDMVNKMIMRASSFSETGIRIANRLHDGVLVDGNQYWVAIPKTTKQIVDGKLVTVELEMKTRKLGWLKIKRSPVTRGAWTIPAEKILWLKEGQCMVVCAAITERANADQDGDCFTITWENATVIREPNVVAAESKAVADGMKADMLEIAEESNLYAGVRKLALENGLDGEYLGFVLGEHAANSVGIMSNVALDVYEENETTIRSSWTELVRYREIVDMQNEGVIKAVKHVESASFWSAKAARSALGVVNAYEAGELIPRAHNIIRKGGVDAIGQDLGDCPTVLQGVAAALLSANIDWLYSMDNSTEIKAIEKAMARIVELKPELFNPKDGSFPSITRILAMDPIITETKKWKGSYNIALNIYAKDVPINEMIRVLSKAGDQSDAMNTIRLHDALVPSQRPLGAIILLCRLWNATRPDSTVALFNSGRSLVEEWAIVAEWIRLSK